MKKRIYNLQNKNVELAENEVHIWNFDLNKIIPLKKLLEKILSDEELLRASKFHFEIDKDRFICSRGLLRILLGIYTGISVEEINFTFNEYGKPSLLKVQNSRDLHFNLSHSKYFMSVGFTMNALIGLDVELIKPLKDHLEIAKRFFSDSENEQLNTFSKEKILEAFYSCWTGKEAVIKLSGEGLSYQLKDFDVQLKELNIGETYKYKVKLRTRDENLFVEVFRLRKDLFGACAINTQSFHTFHCYFDDELISINQLLENSST